MAKKEKESPSTSLDYLHWWEDNTKPKQPHTFGNTISAIKSGIGNAYDMVDIDRELNSLWEEYNVNPNTTPERKKEIESLFVDKYKQAKALAQEQQDKVDWLQEDQGTLAQLGSHAFSAGTSLNSMAMQYGLQGAGALIGGIAGGVLATPETGGLGTLAGAKAGASAGWNALALPSSMYANYRDADDAAAAVRERVMKATGDTALAQLAYEEARLPNLAAVAPSVIVDALTSKYVGGAIGKLAGNGAKVGKAANRMADMMEAARQTRLARGLQRVADTPLGTMAGRAANFIDEFDLPQKAGSWVAGKTNIPALGKLTRGALQFAGEEASEVFQEGEQGISEDTAYENALYKSDPTKYAKPEGWTANRIGNWVNSEEGQRTIVDTLVGTGLTAGLATGVSGFARLDDGYNNRQNLRNVSNILAEQQEGGILYSADPEVNSQMKNTIGARYHLDDERTSALSEEQVIRLSLEDETERAKASGMSEEEASTYAINKYINKRLGIAGRPDYTSEASERFFSKYGIKSTEGLTSLEKRRQEEQEVLKQKPTVATQAHPDTFNNEPKSYIEERKAQGSQGVTEEQESKGSTGILSKLPQVWHDNWVRREVATTGTNDEYENNTALYDNKVTGKVVRVTEMNGLLFVSDVTPKNTKDAEGNPVDAAKTNKFGSPVSKGSRGGQKFTMNKKGLEALNKFFLDNKTNVKELSQEADEQQQATLPPDPNRRRVLIWSANDLANFYRNNSDLMSEDTFMKMTDVLMAYGNNNIPIDLDLERDNNGIVGQTTSEPVQLGVIKAVIHLYMGADAITVLHEFAHVGYDMKSEHEKKLFNAMAQMTQEGFVADVLRKSFNYYADKTNDEIFAMIRLAVQTKDGNVWKDIQSAGVLRLTINIINNEADPDKIQEACEERYAWEFTLWYAEGYLKGRKPDNRMTAMLQRDCRTLGKALKLIGSVAERLQSNGWQAVSGKSMVSMFEEMNNRLYETGDPNVRRTYGGLSRQIQGGYQLNPEIFNNPERRLYTNPLETAMPYNPQVTSMPMQFGAQSQMLMPYNPQATTMPMNYGNPMENTMQQSVPLQAQSMPFGAEMQMANAYPNNTYVPNFTSNIPNFQLQSNPEEGIKGARQNLKNMSNKELIDYAESLRGVDPYSFEKQLVMEEMNRRGLSGKFAHREENREVGAYTGEPTSREIMKPETIADMGDAEMNALADMLIEQYNSNLKELGRLMDTSYENAEGDPATQRFIERLRKVVFDKLYDKNRRGMPEGSRQEETQERGEPEKTKVVVHRNKYTQVSDEEAGKILNKAEHGDEEAQKQWESLPFNQRRRVKGEADITEQLMKEQTKKAAETGKPTYTTGQQMREGLQASPFKESRPNEFSNSLENERRSGVRDIVRKISEMSPEEREKYLQDPKFEENPNYKQAKEIYLESLKPHQALRGKKGELIGRQIESVTRSKIAVEMIEEAFPDGLPSDLSEWRDITSSSNVDGERGYQIYNKLFGTKIKPDNKNVSLYVHRSGLVGCIVTNDGKAFPHVLVSNKYKQERSGLLSQMLLMLHAMPKVKTLTVSTNNRSANDMLGLLYIYRRAGFDIVGYNLQDRKIYLRNSNIEGAIKTKGEKLKWKGLAVGRFKEKHEDIKLRSIPQFRNRQELNDYYDGLSDKEEPMTRKQQRNIWDSVNRAVSNFPMTSDKQLRQLIRMVDDKLQTGTSSSKMLARTKLLYNLLKEAAQEELNRRNDKYNYGDESTVLNSLFGAEELKERREEMQKEGRVATDQFKAQELFDDATARFTQEEDEALNAPTEADEPFAESDKSKTNKDSFAIEEISVDSFDRLILSAKQYGIAEDLAKDLKDAFFALQESKRNDEPQEKLNDLEVKFNKLQKSFMDAMQEFSKKIEEAAEEYDKEETDALVDEKQADKNGAPVVRVADDSLRGDITKYNYDDLCRIAMADLLVGEEGKETLYKGLSEDEYITPTEIRRIIGALGRKYDSPNIEGIREGLIFREFTESEKRQIGRVFRKLYRMKLLMDGRFKQGLYGQRGSANSEEWHIFGHAFAFRRWFSGFYAGNTYGFNALKKIMDNNDIPMYLYAFDEKDMATPLSDELANSYRKKIKTITKELTQLRSKRLSEKNNAKKVEYDRQIATRENERMEMMTQLWAHGKDINGDGSYSAEDEIFNRDARQRNWVRKFGYKLGRIDLKKKPRLQTTEQEQKELNEEINREINNKPKEESPLSRKIVVNINSDNVERARIATEKRNREEQAVADEEWAEKKSAEEQELYDYMNGNQEVMSFLKKPIKKPEDILRFNAMNTIAENTSEEMFDRVEEEMDKFLEDLKQMGAFGLGNYEEDEEYKRYTQIKNKLNEQLNKVHDRITGKTQPKQTKQKKQTTATENKLTAQTNTAKRGSTIDDSVLRGRILQAIRGYYKTGEIDMSKIIYDSETVTDELLKKIDSMLENAKKKYAEKNKGNAEPTPTPTPEPTTNKKNTGNKKNKSTKTTQPKQLAEQKTEAVALTDSKLGGRLMLAEKKIKENGELGDYKVVRDGETVTEEQQAKINKRLENARKAYEKSKGETPAPETPTTPKAETTTKNKTNKSATKNKKDTSKKTASTTANTTGDTTAQPTPVVQKQNPQPVAQGTLTPNKKYSAPKGSGELVQSSTPEGEMDKRTKPKGAKEIFGNLYYPDSSDFKQRLEEADLNGTNQKEKSAVMKMVLEEVERIGRNYKASGFGVAETSLDKLERIIDSIEGKNGTSKDVIKRINALRDEIKQYRNRKVTYKESTEKDNINELSSDDGSDINEEGSKTRNMEVDTIPETPVEQNRDVYSITFTKDALAESEENRKRAKNYESEDKYWKKEKNADGSVTFTRQKPQPHHTKTITYSGMHGKEVSKKPLTTVSEGLLKAWDYWKEKAYNVQASIKDLAEMVGAPESWMEFVVTKDMGSLALTAIERGIIKHNSKDKERTVALMDIADAFKGEKEQWNFINYCVAYRVLHDLTPKGIEQKMKPDEARKIIREVESSSDAAKYKEWREKFTEYNKELLHVLVDGNMITEQEYQTLIKEHPNFIPLSKDMSDFDGAMDFLHTHRDLINVQSPLHRIGTSMKEIKNPIIEMQKRTFDYYQRAAQNKAALIFIDKIVNKITTLANGDEVMLNQAILHKLKTQYNKNGTIKDISDANKGIFYVMRNGKKEFYQLSDASVYNALRAMSPQHMEGFSKFVDFAFRKPSQLLRTMATITFDFAIGNLVRDTGEAFITSRHGFVPFYDSLWGMWQMYNDTQWFKEYNSLVGDMTSRLKEDKRIAGVEQSIEDQLMRIPVLGHMALAMKTFNEYMEQGTRIGEYKNARMGYKGLAGRLSKDGVGWITDKDLLKAEKSQTYAAYRAKDITLNFLQHGDWGGWINRYTTFFNAAMQGQYKIIDTLSEIKNNREGFRNEMLLKASLIAFLGFMTGYNGGDDDDYEEAPDWERDNYYVQGNGLRTPKDQLFGKIIGNPFEQLGYMMKKGKLKNDAFKTFEGTIKEFMLPDNLTPVFINLWLGLSGGKDSFKGKQIVPEYMKEKIGYLQKDLSTSNMATDISRFAYDYFGIDVSAKKLDWGLKQFMSNTAKYVDKIYDTGREEITGLKSNRSGHMYLEEDSKGASDYLNFTTGNNILDGILDLGRMAFGKKFIQNQTTFDSMQDFNEEYLRLKRLSSDEERFTKEDEKKYKTFYEPAFKKIKENYQKLSAISKDSSLDPDKKTEKQRPIVKQSIDLARWALKNGGK